VTCGLKKNFGWLFTQAQDSTSIGTVFVYGDGDIPNWALLGEYDNGSAQGKGRTEYLWLPTEDGSAIPLGMYRNGRFFAIHTDHLGTPPDDQRGEQASVAVAVLGVRERQADWCAEGHA